MSEPPHRHRSPALRAAAGAAVLVLAVAVAGCASPAFVYRVPASAPDLASNRSATASQTMVAAAHPLASDAGRQVLRAGGSAVDAAVAVQMVLTLVEPQSSGIGGGAFLLHWDGRTVQAWDGRETAPAAADEHLFLQPDGQPMPFIDGVVGGRSVGVPGAVRMLEAAHRRHGRLPWAALFEPAIVLAEQGFAVTPRLHAQLQAEARLHLDPAAAAYFYQPDGAPWPVGHRLRNPALAAVLRAVAAQGADALHTGPMAADMVRRVREHPTNPGRMTVADLAGYTPVRREPLCTDWLAIYRVCGFPPPSSGHLAIMQMLGLLERLPAPASPPEQGLPGADWIHAYTESARLAFADRALHVADPDYVAAPAGRWTSLLDDAYLRQRAALVGPHSMKVAPPGVPQGATVGHAAQPSQPEYGTSHISIVDGHGQALAMTTTIEALWASRILADGGTGLPGGFLLNNQLTDFSFAPADAQGRPIANRVQPGKRPRSSMSPTLVFDRRDGRLLMSLGSPGGAAIIHFTAKALIGMGAWGLAPQEAIDSPNLGSTNGPTLLEAGRFPVATIEALKARGHVVQEVELTSGLQAIRRTPTGWVGGADRRREGIVLGD